MSLESWKRLVSRSPLLTTVHITKQENLLELLGVLVESPPHRIQLRHLRVEENYVAGANVSDRRKN
jgi:hypothetical protein